VTDLAECILGHWIHSHEEDTESATIYRRSGYTFPPSRGRLGLEFQPDGRLIYHGIRGGDGTEHLPGRWKLERPNQIRIEVESAQVAPFTLQVLSCANDILKVLRNRSS
jgi:hypothetical protein